MLVTICCRPSIVFLEGGALDRPKADKRASSRAMLRLDLSFEVGDGSVAFGTKHGVNIPPGWRFPGPSSLTETTSAVSSHPGSALSSY
jgi:hypothetical protein